MQHFANEIATEKVEPLIIETDLSIVALVGDNMKSHPGISGRMFGALGKKWCEYQCHCTRFFGKKYFSSYFNKDVKKAINVLHEEFFETTYKQVNLFIAGTGNVGSKLLRNCSSNRISCSNKCDCRCEWLDCQ